MSLCENTFDCNRRSLEELIKINEAVNQLQHKVDRLQQPSHGFVYYLMSEIAVIYVLYMLRNHLTLRLMERCYLGLISFYQRMLSFRTIIVRNCSSSRSSPESVELGETSTVNTESTICYGVNVSRVNREDTPNVCHRQNHSVLPADANSSIMYYEVDEINSNTISTTTSDSGSIDNQRTAPDQYSVSSVEQTVEPSEAATTARPYIFTI